MTLEKAIKIKTRTGEDYFNADSNDRNEADRLSIEALKRLKEHRENHIDIGLNLLPGETED